MKYGANGLSKTHTILLAAGLICDALFILVFFVLMDKLFGTNNGAASYLRILEQSPSSNFGAYLFLGGLFLVSSSIRMWFSVHLQAERMGQ